MQERMARNARDINLAFHATESAIRDAEKFLDTLNGTESFQAVNANDNGLYVAADFDEVPNWKREGLWNSSRVIVAPTQIAGVAEQPKYIIEFMKTVVSDADTLNIKNFGQNTESDPINIFRVTARGTGGMDTSHVMIQSTYGI